MSGDDVKDSQALTSGDFTKYRALVARNSYMSQDRSNLKFSQMQVCRAMGKRSVRNVERQKDRKIPRSETESKVLVPLAAERRPGSVLRR